MADKSTTTANLTLNFLLGGATATAPTARYMALLTAVSSIPGASVTEVSGGSYARQVYASNPASGGSSTNSGTVTFSGLPACTVSNFALYDAATAGNLILVGSLSSAQTVTAGNSLVFNPASVTISES